MSAPESTLSLEASRQSGARATVPALVAIQAGTSPVMHLLPLEGGRRTLGRAAIGPLPQDPFASRLHADVRLTANGWHVRDLESRNGTSLNGARVGTCGVDLPREQPLVLRIGQRIYLGTLDATAFQRFGVRTHEGFVVGPQLAEALALVRELGAAGESVLLVGESGAGKELAARAFHEGGGEASRPCVAVNAATIPEGVAERMLFGAVRGAYSGAVDAAGLIEAAEGGTLFLDELGELPLPVQAKLLRVLETRELLRMGAVTPRAVNARFCFATLRNLRALVHEQKFRGDLFFRVARNTVCIPPLRERLADIPWLIARALDDVGLTARPSFVEACMLRPWPGNVRELLARVREAGRKALREERPEVSASDLPPEACDVVEAPPAAFVPRREHVDVQQVRAALAAHEGNLAAAARSLGVARPTFYRMLARMGLGRSDDVVPSHETTH